MQMIIRYILYGNLLLAIIWCYASKDQLKKDSSYLISSPNVNPQTLVCKKARWLHTPKTGSSFCLALESICCKEQFLNSIRGIDVTSLDRQVHRDHQAHLNQSFHYTSGNGCFSLENKLNKASSFCSALPVGSNHQPLPVDFDFDKSQALGLFREPKSRAVSAFLDSFHHEGMPEAEYTLLKEKINNISHSNKNWRSPNELFEVKLKCLEVFASSPYLVGCQVKMILGYECMSSLLIDNPKNESFFIKEAILRLKKFYFVGLLEHFNLSVALFHSMAQRNSTPSVFELYPTRVNANHTEEVLLASRLVFNDPFDARLYREASHLFAANIRKFLPNFVETI